MRNVNLPPKLENYMPETYDGVVETDAILDSENQLFGMMAQQFNNLFDNQYVLTATEWGIARYEKMLNIIVDPITEDLAFRRERVLNRLTMNPPYTTPFLRSKLDDILGVGGYNLIIEYDNYTFIVESAADNFLWYEEIAITIGKIKPANLVYITRPLITRDLRTNETINFSEMTWNYMLNGSWKLGAKPFVSLADKGVIKLPSTNSVKSKLFDILGGATKDAITHIMINNTYKVTIFTATSTVGVDDGKVVLTYSVPATSNLGVINNVAVYNNQDKLSESSIYVPLVQDVEMKHTIIIKEGV